MRTLSLSLLFCACGPVESTDTPPTPMGDGLFSEGCGTPGASVARVIGVDGTLPGKNAVGTRGDYLLANDRAAFVISAMGRQPTFWYYGGALVDAVTVADCVAGPDKLRDLGLVFGTADFSDVEQSVLRAFRAEHVEVLHDGTDGEAAVVRATGTDDLHWLVEYTLVRQGLNRGGRPVSSPLQTEITVDYILPPDSDVLKIEVTVENLGDEELSLLQALLINFGDTLETFTYASSGLDLAGFSVDGGLPWMMSTDEAGAYAIGIEDAALASMDIAGIRVLTDIRQLTSGVGVLAGESLTFTNFFAVGATGGSSATGPLLKANPRPIRSSPAAVGRISGSVSAADVSVVLEAAAPGAGWGVLDRMPVSSAGDFELVVPDFEEPWDFRVSVRGPGRDDAAPVEVVAGQSGVVLEAEPHGSVQYELVDGAGSPSPGRIYLRRRDGTVVEDWLMGAGEIGVPPGRWSYTVTRGYEVAPARGELTVPAEGSASLRATLVEVVDTDGWLSADTHVHSSDSPDSDISTEAQLLHAAAHGLDVVIHTEHENIVDRSALPAALGLTGWVSSVIGEEVTAVSIEHMTMFPAVPDGSPRGGFVEWYHEDIESLFEAMRTRSGGGINLLNHPGYLNDIQWDRVHARPGLTDPTLLGFSADTPLWSWNLDGIEVMNGHNNIWIDGNRRFDNWMSMINAGHRVVGVGCSDDHHGWEVGFPRSYFPSSTNDPAGLNTGELVEGYRTGALITSAGGFARVEVDSAGPGELVTDTDGSVDLSVHLEALPEVDMTHFVVFVNCDMVDSVLVTDPAAVVKYDGVLPVPVVGDAQVVLAAFGAHRLPAGLPQYDGAVVPRVISNPIYVDGDGDGAFSAPGGRECSYNIDVSEAF